MSATTQLSLNHITDVEFDSNARLDDIRIVLMEIVKDILTKINRFKKEIHTIINGDLMAEKKPVCDVIVDVAKKLEEFPYGGSGYQPGKVPTACAFQPKLIAFHNNMDLLIWENCSKISIIEDYIDVCMTSNKLAVVGIILREVRTLLDVNTYLLPPAEVSLVVGSPEPTQYLSPVSEQTDHRRSIGRMESLSLRNAMGSMRGSKNQTMKEIAIVDDIISCRLPVLKGQQSSELFMELISERAALLENNPHEYKERLLQLRRRNRQNSDPPAPPGANVGSQRGRHRERRDTEPPLPNSPTTSLALSHSTGSMASPLGGSGSASEPGGHLLSLFVPPTSNNNNNLGASGELASPAGSRYPRKTTSHLAKGMGGLDTPEPPPTEPLYSPIANVKGYTQDLGQPYVNAIGKITFVDPEKDINFYARDFFNYEHFNYMGHDKQGNPVLASILIKKCEGSSTSDAIVLIRNPDKDEELAFVGLTTKQDHITAKKALQMLKKKEPRLGLWNLEEVTDTMAKKTFKDFEERQIKTQYRMGVLYCKNGQTTEDEMYSNEHGSAEFNEFLESLGTTITLKGWTKFRGGLDVRNGTTGTTSLHTEMYHYEIMFHVSTMLPFQPNDSQRVERKRHLGNDVVVVVFIENPDNTPIVNFDPSMVKSQFNSVFIIVTVDPAHPKTGPDGVVHYKVYVASKEGVVPFGPDFPQNYSFPKGEKFRNFIVAKIINAERAALHAPIFAQKIRRTRKEALEMMFGEYILNKD
eukprot:TRINITY_DN4185_c0_g1_i1.p1 TRINITY_DN4185_c0_g1~~TRINITY_DN4185_c0_g1_i1.p1  ORF type:complete len:753 (-),score=165.74 TRINITY_DN4185_c0_g1_i1:61-2319(-)